MGSKEDQFNERTYIEHNPTLGYEDVNYKFSYIQKLLDELNFNNQEISILDVGGGGGFLGKVIVEYFMSRGCKVNFYALDVSLKMLEVQKSNNPYITDVFNCYLDELAVDVPFDLLLMIDVIEHIPNKDAASQKIQQICNYALYNIPSEVNLMALLKNVYMKNNYYKMQRDSLGHLHFFTYKTAYNHFCKFFSPLKYLFPNYAQHILYTDTTEFDVQRNNKLRRYELIISLFLYKYLKFLAPYLVDGSLFIVGKSKR